MCDFFRNLVIFSHLKGAFSRLSGKHLQAKSWFPREARPGTQVAKLILDG
jgi:hypothetical protein